MVQDRAQMNTYCPVTATNGLSNLCIILPPVITMVPCVSKFPPVVKSTRAPAKNCRQKPRNSRGATLPATPTPKEKNTNAHLLYRFGTFEFGDFSGPVSRRLRP